MFKKSILILISGLFWATTALAQPQLVGPLDARNNLSEIAGNGSAAQATARGNLGLGSIATQGAGSVAITGGNIAGADVSSSVVTPTGGNAPISNATRAAQVINVLDYGAKCNGTADDAPAINLAISQIRTMVTANMQTAVVLEFPPSINNGTGGLNFRRCIVHSTLNFTGIYSTLGNTLNVTIEGHGTEIYGSVPGAPVIDALGSNQILWHNIHIISDNVNVPTYGIQIGRTATTLTDYGGGAGMRFDDCTIVGYFSTAAFYNFAGEEVTFTRPRFVNSYNSATAYAYIEDGYNHFNITSAFVTETAPVDTAQSFEETTIIGGSLQGNGALMVSPVWLGAVTQHRFVNVYIYAGQSSPSCVTLFNEAAGIYMGIKGLDLDIHCEGSALTNKILITGQLNTPVIRDLTIRDVYEFSTGTIFSLGGSTISTTLEHLNLSISGGPASPVFTVFDTPASYAVTGAEIYLYNAAPWLSSGNGPNPFSGHIVLPGTSGTQNYVNMNCAIGTVSPLNGNSRSYQSALQCLTTLSGETSVATPLRLTSDTLVASKANCVNLLSAGGTLGSVATVKVNVVARDRSATSNYVVWQDWPVIYGNTLGNSANTFVILGTKPTPISAGTVTGTDVTITADQTNNCLNVSWTPPTGNTDIWDAVASVAFTQVR